MTPNTLTEDDFKTILNTKFPNEVVVFQKAKYSLPSIQIEGFMGDHFILEIIYKKYQNIQKVQFFVKTKPTKSEYQKYLEESLNSFKKETFFYHCLVKKFCQQYFMVDFCPRSYLCKNGNTIVMENLIDRHFQILSRGSFFSLEHCKIVLKALAKFHGYSILLEESISKDYHLNEVYPEVFQEMIFQLNGEGSFGDVFFSNVRQILIAVSKLLPECTAWKDSFKEKLLSLDLPKVFNQNLPLRKCVCHGDLWSNNMLFQYENCIPKTCILVDFQNLRYHYPSYDALLLLYSNTSKDFWNLHLVELLNYHYDSLQKILGPAGIVLSKKDYFQAADSLKVVGLIQAVSSIIGSRIPSEVLSQAVNAGGDAFEQLVQNNTLKDIFLEICGTNSGTKHVIFDIIYEINDCL